MLVARGPLPALVIALVALVPLALVGAAQKQQQLAIYNGSATYAYHGCYNETTQVAGSERTRALSGGTSDVRPGAMTVPLCLAICAGGAERYRYAGLEWARRVARSPPGVTVR